MIRTRFAPSPTGMMHVGNLRTMLFEYLIAKHSGGDFILRIEDTDRQRYVKGAEEVIYKTLELCNIKIDEGPLNPKEYGPYIQSERIEIYKKYAHKLVEMGKAYYCFCDEELLNEQRKEAEKKKEAFLYDGRCSKISLDEAKEKIASGKKYVIRQKMPKEGVSTFIDLVYGKIEVENKILEDQILLKSDGYPTYNFANVIDDHLMNITHIVRGNEYIMATPKYNHLYDAFGWEKPIYIHLPLVLGEDKVKLSKRNGDASFLDLYEKGFLPEAIINYLVLLGFSPTTNDEIFSLDELIKIFDPKRISKSPAVFDIKKLEWINAKYIKKLDQTKLNKITLPHLENAYDLSDKSNDWINDLIKLYQDELSYGKEIVEKTCLFFTEDIEVIDDEVMHDETVPKTLEIFKKQIEVITDWNIENITNALNNTKDEANVKGKLLFMPIRIKVSGQMHGPELINTIYLLGKEKVLNRLNNK